VRGDALHRNATGLRAGKRCGRELRVRRSAARSAFEPLASVLATEPDPLVVDEPTRGVDPERKLELALLLRA
jgi:ABC-type histidine transport system ATPase subunit